MHLEKNGLWAASSCLRQVAKLRNLTNSSQFFAIVCQNSFKNTLNLGNIARFRLYRHRFLKLISHVAAFFLDPQYYLTQNSKFT